MKLNDTNLNHGNVENGTTFKGACLASCQRILAQVVQVKEAIFAESCAALQSQEHLLRLALNEAEAAARQTLYPHLVFPTLAMEKVQAVAAWNRRQESVRRTNPGWVLAV